ncbi:MAG: PIG-L deacetylase family protein [Acidimicrobiales bacterium]
MPDPVTLEPVPEDWDRCLAVVAHPDDLEYGAASALARWSAQGKTVAQVLATRGEAGIDSMAPAEARELRTREQQASGAIVGATAVEFLDHPDGTLVYGLDLRRDLARAIRRHRPDVIATISFRNGFFGGPPVWNHADHRVLGEALIDAVRDAANRWVFPELIDEGHEPWGGVRFVAAGASPRAGHYVDVSDAIDVGMASLRAHAAYLEALGDTGETETRVRSGAASVGALVGVDHAIAFELI